MNAQVQESTEVAVIPPKPLTVIERAMSVFIGVPSEERLRELAKESATITTITNQAGWEQCHAARMVLKNTRLAIASTGEAGREDAVQTSRSIIAIQKSRIAITQAEEDRLAAIEKAWDDRIKAEKEARIQAEIKRVADLQERVNELRGCQTLSPSSGSTLILERIADIERIAVDESFAEFQQQASDAKIAALVRLNGILGAAVEHEAAQAKLKRDLEDLAKLRAAEEARQATAEAERVERERLAKVETDRIAKEAKDKAVAEARAHAEQIRKDNEAQEANRQRNEATLQEIQAIHHQLMIADTGRAPYCKGGDLESIDFAIDGTEKWELTEERFGALFAMAVKTKETTLTALRAKRVDFVTRQANAAETARLADQQAEIERQQEAIRKANEPKPPVPPTPEPTAAQPGNWPITDAQLVALVMSHCNVGKIKADRRIRDYGVKTAK